MNAHIIQVAIAIVTTIITMYLIYKHTGWVSFTMNKGENFAYSLEPEKVANILFRDCYFTVISENGTVGPDKYNVTSVLNNMINAYQGNTNSKYIFKLDDPGLSAFSFHVPNFNDSNTHPTGEWLDENPNQQVILTGFYKLN
jgi:hypothetical protein